jgi:hypothetical protein
MLKEEKKGLYHFIQGEAVMNVKFYKVLCLLLFSFLAAFILSCEDPPPVYQDKIGVLYLSHGGMETNKSQYMWDAVAMQFSFDHNHPVYRFVLWNPFSWGTVLATETTEFALKYLRLFDFEYERIGGTDLFNQLTEQQVADIQAALDNNTLGLTFEVDWAGFQCADRIENYPYPRYIYKGPNIFTADPFALALAKCRYCGRNDPDGPWEGCNPERYNVDGPVERLLKKGVSRIIAVDLMMGGVRYSKMFDAINMSQRALDAWNEKYGTSIELTWINDYTNLMWRSYPTEPEGWTGFLGEPTTDSKVPYEEGPNPVIADPEIAALHLSGVEAGMSDIVSDNDTGVVFLNHALHMDYNEVFDPKLSDTVVLMQNIKAQLREQHPDMDPDNIIGAFLGKPEINPENGLPEHNRDMRGEVYGYAWLYESDKQLPGGKFGYRAWEAFEYLKNRGVKHIVVANTHVVTESVLDLVEMPNQVAREIGYKTWAKWGTWDYESYPDVGHPFADYWGIWLNTDCGEWKLDYADGISDLSLGATLAGKSSKATAIIKWLDGDVQSGTLTLKKVTGSFLDGERITDDSGGIAFADGTETMTSKKECCFGMGGCDDPHRPYPPVRQTPINQARSDLDPSLVYDISAYGHLGYDPSLGPPDDDNPVQDQYTGTWSMYATTGDDPRMGRLMAKHVLEFLSEGMNRQ